MYKRSRLFIGLMVASLILGAAIGAAPAFAIEAAGSTPDLLVGVVTSVHEAAALRTRFGSGPVLVTPGIRPAGAEVGDQKRVATPAVAAFRLRGGDDGEAGVLCLQATFGQLDGLGAEEIVIGAGE